MHVDDHCPGFQFLLHDACCHFSTSKKSFEDDDCDNSDSEIGQGLRVHDVSQLKPPSASMLMCPPVTLATSAKPRCLRMRTARCARKPERQCTTMRRSL